MRPIPSPLAALAALALAATARAQPSTSRLPEADAQSRALRFEVSAGASVVPIPDIVGVSSSDDLPEPYALLAALRWSAESAGGVRLMTVWLGRDQTLHLYDQGNPRRSEIAQRLLGLAGAVDASWRPSRRASVAMSLGGGLASARGGHQTWTSSGSSVERATETGRLIMAGLALRYRSLVIEQHGIVLLGAEGAVPFNREFFPLTIGWRF